jgi:peptide/nickel transport system permease protein
VSAPATAAEPVSVPPPPRAARPLVALARTAIGFRRTQIGLVLTLALVGIALIGPFFSPHSPSEFVGVPYSGSTSNARFGTDGLGRDVFSRFLWGGRSVLALASLATLLGLLLGVTVGLVAAYSRGRLDDLLMRTTDIGLAFPQIMLALVAVATVGPKPWLLVLAIGITTAPRVARVARGAALTIVERDFVLSAESLGESRSRILLAEVLPNITSPLLVEASLRLTYSVSLVASLGFLGFGLKPPAADWGLMINENRLALVTQPWGSVLPVIAIALLTIGTSLVGDGLARATIGIDRGGE